MDLGGKIYKLRKARGMSQEHLAEEIGVSRQAVSKWELNESTPDTEKIVSISQLFGVSTDFLLGNEMERKNDRPSQRNSGAQSSLGFISQLIQEKGYIAGYMISGYATLFFLFTRLGHYMFSQILLPSEEFGLMFEQAPAEMLWPLKVMDVLSIAAGVAFVGGLILAFFLKRKRDAK